MPICSARLSLFKFVKNCDMHINVKMRFKSQLIYNNIQLHLTNISKALTFRAKALRTTTSRRRAFDWNVEFLLAIFR